MPVVHRGCLWTHRCKPRGWSVSAEAARRLDCLEVGEIEIADCLQRICGSGVLQTGRQRFQPGGILSLQCGQLGDGVIPVLDSAAVIDRRRVRMTGTPAERAARHRAWRSASVMGFSPIGLRGMAPLRSVTSRNPCHTGPVQARFFIRQLSLPVSMMSQWWVSRSSNAVAILVSPNTDGHSAKARLVVTTIEVRS